MTSRLRHVRSSLKAVIRKCERRHPELGENALKKLEAGTNAPKWTPKWSEVFRKPAPESVTKSVAGGLGFEPRLAESESAVLPLDDPPPGRNVELKFRPCKAAEQDSCPSSRSGGAGKAYRGDLLACETLEPSEFFTLLRQMPVGRLKKRSGLT